MTMASWNTRKIAKKRTGSQTEGAAKGETCKVSQGDRYFAKRSRSYKDPGYKEWCERVDKLNGMKRS